MEQEKISRALFEKLPVYNTSVPTGVVIGKVWRKNNNPRHPETPDWIICEFVSCNAPGYAAIDRRRPIIVE